ncbi:hypothetical protein PAMA_020656 [Pampus argenteus]
MGSGVCSRRQRRIFQCLLLVTVVCGMMYGGMMSYEMHRQLKRTEATALKYQQHQESLSAQLQVVYEHRSRLEKSLQKERLEHKKAKEDYLVYKLEAQQSLNKEKQDSSSRFNSLQVQHQMLKNQHEDLKKQYYELHEQHQVQGEDHSRLLDEHKERYSKMQQAKEVEVSHLKDSVYNLREENKQLRKAHHDIHTQLQDARIQHQELKTSHDQLALTLEDHKSALAAAQVQVNEYKQLRDSMNKAPNLRVSEQNAAPEQPQAGALAPVSHINEGQPAIALDQPQKVNPAHEEDHQDTESRLDHQEKAHAQSEVKSHPTVSQHNLSEKEEDGEGEAERRRELAEEEMAQAGQPQKLEEDPDQPQDEQQEEEEEEGERGQEQLDENALDRHIHQLQPGPHPDLHQEALPHQEAHGQVERVKSAYEQQKEQQRLEAQRAEERRQIQLRQDALQAQRERLLKEREQRLKQEQEREEQQHREADRREKLLREEQQRKRTEYENINNDIAEGEEEHHPDDDEDPQMLHEEEEKQEADHRVPPHQQGAVEGELDPEDDPNNQGEDEFEEAEDERPQNRVGGEEDDAVEDGEEPAVPAEHVDKHPEPDQPAVEEGLVMAGNPDQQEDTLDDQYQEEVEDEVCHICLEALL